MRIFQIILLALAGAAFIAGAIFIIFFDPCISLVLWRVGVAILVLDIMLFLLWPTSTFRVT